MPLLSQDSREVSTTEQCVVSQEMCKLADALSHDLETRNWTLRMRQPVLIHGSIKELEASCGQTQITQSVKMSSMMSSLNSTSKLGTSPQLRQSPRTRSAWTRTPQHGKLTTRPSAKPQMKQRPSSQLAKSTGKGTPIPSNSTASPRRRALRSRKFLMNGCRAGVHTPTVMQSPLGLCQK